MTHAKLFGVVGALGILLGTAVACSDLSSADALSSPDRNANSKGGSSGSSDSENGAGASPTAPNADLGPTSNGVILVHAALTSSFRLCFKNFLGNLPTPDAELMPESNVVGVEVGAAIRIPPLPGSPGDVFLFSEEIIRQLYPNGQGPTCQALIESNFPFTTVGSIPQDLSKGVHLLVVSGCPKNNVINTRTKAECGESFDPTTGNLEAKAFTLKATSRNNPNELPAQVIHLSQDVESYRASRTLKVTFGDLSVANAVHTSVATNPPLKGAPVDITSAPKFDPQADQGVYKKLGFRVTVDNASGGGVTKLAEQSLANVQLLSAPRDVPSSYYSVGSNYVFLILGETAPKYTDGGLDPNPNRNIHLLAVPVIEPKDEDAGAPGPADGGPK